MEEKKSKYETKLEKLTFLRIFIVLLCEIVFEFSFGLVFYIFTENEGYYGQECVDLVFWARTIWKLYFIEFCIAFICFLIGIMSLLCYKKPLTKLYIGFNNSFKSLIFIASLIIMCIITVVYNEKEKCNLLSQVTFVWLIFHYSLLGIACLACCIILFVTIKVYRKSKRDESNKRASLLYNS